MAIEYFDLQTVQRSAGQSIVAKASYNSGDVLKDDRINKTFDYKSKSGIVHSEIIFPEGMQVVDRQTLWNQVEASENRKNSQIGRSVEIALPIELNQQQRIALARDLALEFSDRYNCPVDISVHEPKKRKRNADKNAENPHTHLLFPDRDQNGNKLRELSQGKKKDHEGNTEIDRLRLVIEKKIQEHLQKNGFDIPFTMRKKPDLSQRKIINEESLRKIDRQIRAVTNAIARLESRIADGNNQPSVQENNPRDTPAQRPTPSIATESHTPAKLDDRTPRDTIVYADNETNRRDERQNISDGPANKSYFEFSGRNDFWETGRAESGTIRTSSESPKFRISNESGFRADLFIATQKLKEKLEILKSQKNLQDIGEMENDRANKNFPQQDYEALKNRAIEETKGKITFQERVIEARRKQNFQGGASFSTQNQSRAASSPGHTAGKLSFKP